MPAIIMGLAVSALGVGGDLWYQQNDLGLIFGPGEQQDLVPNLPVVNQNANLNTNNDSDWQTYANSKFGISFGYDSSWEVTELENADPPVSPDHAVLIRMPDASVIISFDGAGQSVQDGVYDETWDTGEVDGKPFVILDMVQAWQTSA